MGLGVGYPAAGRWLPPFLPSCSYKLIKADSKSTGWGEGILQSTEAESVLLLIS